MLKLSLWQRASKWLALATLFSFVGLGLAMAQAEPTIKQIYAAAESGKVEQAQTMIQQVLIAHPGSARAHFVQAELFARQGLASRGRDALAAADKLAPGLPFAKPEAVQALRAQLAARPAQSVSREPANRGMGGNLTGEAAAPVAPASSFPLGWGLAIGGGAIALVIFLMRKKPAAETAPQAAYAGPNNDSGATGNGIGSGLNGPQTFGNNTGAAMAPPYGQPGYGQPAYGQPAYGQPAGGGMGSRVMGGLATGLAVGAGVMAAQAIGKNLMGNNEHATNLNDGAASNGNGNGYAQPLPGNNDMGGQNFGMNDADSWDDGSNSADSGGGGDWDT